MLLVGQKIESPGRDFSASVCVCVCLSSSCCSVPSPAWPGASRCSCTATRPPPVETERPWCALIRRTPLLQIGSAPLHSSSSRHHERACAWAAVLIRAPYRERGKHWMEWVCALWVVGGVSHPSPHPSLTADYCSRHALMKTTVPPPPCGTARYSLFGPLWAPCACARVSVHQQIISWTTGQILMKPSEKNQPGL